MTRETFGPPADYRIGVRNRWLWGDVDSLMLALRGRRPVSQGPTASRFTEVRRFLKLWGRDLYYENPKWYDPKPFVFETFRRIWSP